MKNGMFAPAALRAPVQWSKLAAKNNSFPACAWHRAMLLQCHMLPS
jgi:hypothetical protein